MGVAAAFGSVGGVGSWRPVGTLDAALVGAAWPAVSATALAVTCAGLLTASRVDALDETGAVGAGAADACTRRKSIA